MDRKNIRKIEDKELTAFLLDIGEKPYRLKQIHEWLWKKGVRDFDSMKNLPKKLIDELKNHFCFEELKAEQILVSSDGTVKFSFLTHDNKITEGVLIPSGSRRTACISTQVGCPLACSFCATGQSGFDRNLSFPEIFDELSIIKDYSIAVDGNSLSNIVIMGMGEPMLNLEATLKMIDTITSPNYWGMSPKRITLSTVGIIKGIYAFAEVNNGVELAVSLHNAIQEERLEIIPVAFANPIVQLSEALKYYYKKTGQRITIEYVLLKNVNDKIEHAEALAQFCKNFPVKVNIIEYNSTSLRFKKSTNESLFIFEEFLKSKNIVVNVRKSRGEDIMAACGQLAAKNKKNKS